MSEIIEAYGYQWEVLDEEYKAADGQGILCLKKEHIGSMTFSKDENNDYTYSDIRKRLSEFTRGLEKRGAEFRTVMLDLTADDGSGWERPKLLEKGAFLLTADMYRKYRRFISERNDLWWLATAYSFNGNYSNNAQAVCTDGSLGGYIVFHRYHCVVPACVFSYLPQHYEKLKELENLKEQIKSIQERLEILKSEV